MPEWPYGFRVQGLGLGSGGCIDRVEGNCRMSVESSNDSNGQGKNDVPSLKIN